MINAKEARERAEQMRVEYFRKEVEKVIKHNIDKGRNEARISAKIPEEIIYELLKNGYQTEETNNLTIIKW